MDTTSQLWNILPYAGSWYTLPCKGCERSTDCKGCNDNTSCNRITHFEEPKLKSTYLVGTPYSGDNTGANPNLRLLTFNADTIEGPIRVAGVQMIFFNNLLRHRIKWKIEPISEVDKVNIGFYTFNYVNRDLGNNKLIPLITTAGPAFYKGIMKGRFITSEFNNMYVVVDANVVVKLWVSYKVPKHIEVPCLDKLFVPYNYYVNDNGCKELAATEELINKQTNISYSTKTC